MEYDEDLTLYYQIFCLTVVVSLFTYLFWISTHVPSVPDIQYQQTTTRIRIMEHHSIPASNAETQSTANESTRQGGVSEPGTSIRNRHQPSQAVPPLNTSLIAEPSIDHQTYRDEYTPDISESSDVEEEARAEAKPDLSSEAKQEKANDAGNGLIKMKLRFIDDTIKQVEANLLDTIAVFRRDCISTFTGEDKEAKLIYQGKVLKDESTLRECGLFNNCVLHCFITKKKTPEQVRATPARAQEEPLDFGPFLWILMLGSLIACWMLLYHYPVLFGGPGLYMLSIVSLGFLLIIATLAPPVDALLGTSVQLCLAWIQNRFAANPPT